MVHIDLHRLSLLERLPQREGIAISIVIASCGLCSLKESIDGICGVQRCVPSLGALLLQQPPFHLVDGSNFSGLQYLVCLDGGSLSRNLIVEPTVQRLARIEVASHLLLVDRILADTLEILLCNLRPAVHS